MSPLENPSTIYNMQIDAIPPAHLLAYATTVYSRADRHFPFIARNHFYLALCNVGTPHGQRDDVDEARWRRRGLACVNE